MNTKIYHINGDEVTLLCDQEDCCHIADQDIEWVVDLATLYHCVPKRED